MFLVIVVSNYEFCYSIDYINLPCCTRLHCPNTWDIDVTSSRYIGLFLVISGLLGTESKFKEPLLCNFILVVGL